MRFFHTYPLTIIVAGTALSFGWMAVSSALSPVSSYLAWGSIANLSNSDNPSDAAVIAVSGDTIHVVWVETVAGQPQIYYVYKVGDGSWSEPTRLEAGTQPDLAVGPDGTVDLVWLDENESGAGFKASFVRYRRWSPTLNTWLDAANVAVGGLGTLQSPALVVGSGGVTHVVWVDSVGGTPRIRYRHRSALGWSSPENVASGVNPAINVDPAGRLHVVWVGLSLLSKSHDIYYRWRDPNGRWSLTYVLSNNDATDSLEPAAAIDQDGVLHVAWQEPAGDNTSTILYRSGHEASWPSGPELAAALTGRAEAPAIIVDGHRVVHLVFAGPNGIQHRVREPATRTWYTGEAVAVDQPAATAPHLTIGVGDTLHAVWAALGLEGWTDIYYRSTAPDVTLTETPAYTPTRTATTTPTVTLIATGTPTVTLTPPATRTSTPTQTAAPALTPTATGTLSPEPTTTSPFTAYLPLVLHGPANIQTGLESNSASRRQKAASRSSNCLDRVFCLCDVNRVECSALPTRKPSAQLGSFHLPSRSSGSETWHRCISRGAYATRTSL